MYKRIEGKDSYLKTHIQSTKITLIRVNFPTLALDFVITVHITTYKCRQTIAEVQLSCYVNQDTRQTCERKTYCQAKNVKMYTQHFIINHLWLPEGRPSFKVDQRDFLRHFPFCLNYVSLLSITIFFLIKKKTTKTTKQLRGGSRNMHFHTEAGLPIAPRLSGSDFAGGLVADDDGG